MGNFQAKKTRDFIGKGIVFPLTLTNGSVSIVSGKDLIKSSIRNILAHQVSTRFFLGEFGSRIEDLIEEVNLDLLSNTLETFIRDSLRTWEKRIEVDSVIITHPSNTKVDVEIQYTIIDTQQPDNLVWPFYKDITI